MKTKIVVPAFVLLFSFGAIFSALFMNVLSADASVTRAMLFHNGEIVGTTAVPAAMPNGGRDPLYEVTNGVTGQLGITAVAPGDNEYHGGAWAVYRVTFNASTTPYLLTSQAEVETALAAGDVSIVRVPELDNRCPIQSPRQPNQPV